MTAKTILEYSSSLKLRIHQLDPCQRMVFAERVAARIIRTICDLVPAYISFDLENCWPLTDDANSRKKTSDFLESLVPDELLPDAPNWQYNVFVLVQLLRGYMEAAGETSDLNEIGLVNGVLGELDGRAYERLDLSPSEENDKLIYVEQEVAREIDRQLEDLELIEKNGGGGMMRADWRSTEPLFIRS